MAHVDETKQEGRTERRGVWRRPWVRWVVAAAGVGAVVLAGVSVYAARHVGSMVRASLVKGLSERFHAPVELDRLDVSIVRGIEIRGGGLRVLNGDRAMVRVDSFRFRVSRHDLVTMHARVERVLVEGMELHIPPHGMAQAFHRTEPRQPTISFELGTVECRDAKLYLETERPGKEPLEFDLRSVTLTDANPGSRMQYVADVVNPKPHGDIHAFGHLGPWVPDNPRTSALDGDFRFDHGEMNTIKGLGGTLSATGHFAGQLGKMVVDGTASVPDFSLDVSGHAVPLATKFHALVDGTNGDTTLAPVEARLGQSSFTAEGTVAKVAGRGHDIALTVDMPRGRVEDLLVLGIKTMPPVMRGTVTMKEKLHIPPGDVRVAQKMEMAGNLKIVGVVFGNPKLQDKVDGLSMRAQGKPEEARTAGSDRSDEVRSEMNVTFTQANGQVQVPELHYEMPGAKVDMVGAYSMDGNMFEFKGHVRTEAKASQMVTGWKSVLLMPFDKMLAKNGAGVQLPIEVSGAKGDVKFGLAMGGTEGSSKEMAEELRRKQGRR